MATSSAHTAVASTLVNVLPTTAEGKALKRNALQIHSKSPDFAKSMLVELTVAVGVAETLSDAYAGAVLSMPQLTSTCKA